jgi:SAM-dependent methyltransferase
VALASQSRAFYAALRESFARLGAVPLAEARVLDFGCGWGRLTRLLARDVEPGALFGCDPLEGILDVARADGVPAVLARSEFRPREIPFEERFDLAFAFSVFTHLSEPAHEACLDALHASLAPGGVLAVTVRPPAYLERCEAMRPLLDSLGEDPDAALERPQYLFVPHESTGHLLSGPDGRMDFGETFVSMTYIRERWSERFELAGARLVLEDPYQVMIVLRRR